MICPVCRQDEIVDGLTVVVFERGEFKLSIYDVPARICLRCGDAYVDANIAIQLLSSVQKRYEAGLLETQAEYSTL